MRSLMIGWLVAGAALGALSCQAINDTGEFVILGLSPDAGAPQQPAKKPPGEQPPQEQPPQEQPPQPRECNEGDQRSCPGAMGNCSRGEQTCQADLTWGPCSIQPREDTCEPGDDGNCDGVPNAPSTGACACTVDVACGPSTDQGECRFGVSVCTNGVPGPCTGAV